jgi:hypothetical protein
MGLFVLVGRQEAVLVESDPVSDFLDIFFTSTRIHETLSYRDKLAKQLFDGDTF